MALITRTYSGTTYTYLRYSNEIVEGNENEEMVSFVFNERKPISAFPNLNVFTLGVTTKCNLRCSYCCYSGSYRNTRTHGISFIPALRSSSRPLRRRNRIISSMSFSRFYMESIHTPIQLKNSWQQ